MIFLNFIQLSYCNTGTIPEGWREMSTVDELTGAKVSVNPAGDGSSVVEEESDERSSLPPVRKLLLLAAAATASNGLLLMLSLSILGYIIDFLN